ncbi:glycosyltransferase family 39 protein [Patescibacteria group bacterium]|nr:glycosyltransferase family 39 protein [Patescibacteria group bacterium]
MLKQVFKFFRENLSFVLIISLAAILRFVAISDNPPSLNWDEVSHGYNAYSILMTGKDEWGQIFPSIFRAYGDYKLPVYIYFTALSEFIFGLNAFAVRLPSVLAGIATVFFSFLLAKHLFKEKLLAVIVALLVAIEPWSLFLSRGAFEANLALAFIVSGVYFFLVGLDKPKNLIYSSLLLGISVWTYNSARIFVPIFLLFIIFIFRKEIRKLFKKSPSTIYMSLITAVVFLLPMFWQLFSPSGQARYGRVAILDEGAIAQINEGRVTSGLSPDFARLAHNKATFFIGRFAKNWVSHFTTDFLFIRGGSNYQFSIPGHGLLYSINAIFLVVGIFYLLKKRTRESMLVLGWFFLGPVASSLTREAPHVLRSITILPAPMIIAAIGVVAAWNWIKKRNENFAKVLLPVYLIVLLFHFENYAQKAVVEYRDRYSWAWQYGYEQVVDYTKANYDDYDKIIVTKKYGEPHEFFLFFWPWIPDAYRNDPNLKRFYQSNWYWVDGFDKFYFVNDWQVNEEGTGNYMFNLESGGVIDCLIDRCLLITSPGNYPVEWSKLETINFLDGQKAFEIYEN